MTTVPEGGLIPKGLSQAKGAGYTTYYFSLFGFLVSARVEKDSVKWRFQKKGEKAP